MAVDWVQLARDVGSIDSDNTEHGGTSYAIAALEQLVEIEATVPFIIDGGPGTELAMNVLRYLQSERAARLAYDIYRAETGVRAAHAVWLVKQIAHPCSLPWIADLLRDDNAALWGVGVLDQLLWCRRVEPADVEALIVQAEQHANENVREQAAFIRGYLAARTRALVESTEGRE